MGYDAKTRGIAPGCVPVSDDSQDRFYNDPVMDYHYGSALGGAHLLRSIGLRGVEPWHVFEAGQRLGAKLEHALDAVHFALEALSAGEPTAPQLIAEAQELSIAVLRAARRDSPLSPDRAPRGAYAAAGAMHAAAVPSAPAPGEPADQPTKLRQKSRRAARRFTVAWPTLLAAFGSLRYLAPWFPPREDLP